ncbi:hypothetical protein ACJX0J_040905, partial [Zea mays]
KTNFHSNVYSLILHTDWGNLVVLCSKNIVAQEKRQIIVAYLFLFLLAQVYLQTRYKPMMNGWHSSKYLINTMKFHQNTEVIPLGIGMVAAVRAGVLKYHHSLDSDAENKIGLRKHNKEMSKHILNSRLKEIFCADIDGFFLYGAKVHVSNHLLQHVMNVILQQVKMKRVIQGHTS